MIPRTMLSAAAALVVAGLATGLSQATAPGKNGRIAFSRYELHDTPLTAHIVVANSDGSGQRTITHASRVYRDDHPHWAPHGSRIVFDRCGFKSSCHLWTMRPDGSDLRRLGPRCPSGAPTSSRCPRLDPGLFTRRAADRLRALPGPQDRWLCDLGRRR